jgi:hypothetical protein
MPDPTEERVSFDTAGDERGYVGHAQEQVPGHTPGMAEGEDEDAPHLRHPHPDPDSTPGSAEG